MKKLFQKQQVAGGTGQGGGGTAAGRGRARSSIRTNSGGSKRGLGGEKSGNPPSQKSSNLIAEYDDCVVDGQYVDFAAVYSSEYFNEKLKEMILPGVRVYTVEFGYGVACLDERPANEMVEGTVLVHFGEDVSSTAIDIDDIIIGQCSDCSCELTLLCAAFILIQSTTCLM